MDMSLGYLLILVGLALILFEVITPGLYFPAIGIALLIYGIFLIFLPSLALPVAILSGLITVYIMYRLVYNVGSDIKIGAERFVGRELILPNDLDEQRYGLITIDNEKWHIKAKEPLKKGDKIKIVGIEGVSLVVEKINNTEINTE
ncbi:NfeD family protein [Methanothermococcus sp. Ax23]|jgi:membrane protein implicated in regulation of membrane protease activity|uniref:NfeD family protein n=1 Tax=Methanothermococcus sp. Ax23 TaxID=3156486 RepID=UPI003BA38B65